MNQDLFLITWRAVLVNPYLMEEFDKASDTLIRRGKKMTHEQFADMIAMYVAELTNAAERIMETNV